MTKSQAIRRLQEAEQKILKALFGRPEIMSVTDFSKISALITKAIKKAKQS